MTLTPPHLRWLSLIRYQARIADEQSALPPPLGTLAINGLQDAVEAMLGLVAEHHNIAVQNKPPFDKLFEAVANHFPALAAYRGQLLALNNARVGYKHHGNEVAETTVERHRIRTMAFLAEVSQVCLGQDFDAISLAGLIGNPSVRRAVEQAEVMWRNGDERGALLRLRNAFNLLIRFYDGTEPGGRRQFTSRPSGWSAVVAQQAQNTAVFGAFGDMSGNHTERWLRNLDDRVKLLSLGVDGSRYMFLDMHAPRREFDPVVDNEWDQIPNYVFERCHRFVVDSALKLEAGPFHEGGAQR